jgi:hypothetical protein
MVGSARKEALHNLEGIVNRLRDLAEPALSADADAVQLVVDDPNRQQLDAAGDC